jgi:hypothetical protein
MPWLKQSAYSVAQAHMMLEDPRNRNHESVARPRDERFRDTLEMLRTEVELASMYYNGADQRTPITQAKGSSSRRRLSRTASSRSVGIPSRAWVSPAYGRLLAISAAGLGVSAPATAAAPSRTLTVADAISALRAVGATKTFTARWSTDR